MKYLIKLINNNVEVGYIENGEVKKDITKKTEKYEIEINFYDEKIVNTAIRSIIETYSVINKKHISDLNIEEKIDILEKSLHRIFGNDKIKINKIENIYSDTGLII